MLTNVLVFVACLSEREEVILEGRKCNIASAVVGECIKMLVVFVSMSLSIYTIRHSSSRNPTQN